MVNPKRPQKKKENLRPYRTLFLIAVEGETEQCYFQSLNSRLTDAFIMASTPKTGSSPKQVGDHINTLIERQKRNPRLKLRASDQAWVVIDRDNWPEDVLETSSFGPMKNQRPAGLRSPIPILSSGCCCTSPPEAMPLLRQTARRSWQNISLIMRRQIQINFVLPRSRSLLLFPMRRLDLVTNPRHLMISRTLLWDTPRWVSSWKGCFPS